MKLKDNSHFGLMKHLGAHLYELKFKTLGGGIRVYYGIDCGAVVILLGGGNKASQKSDINNARKLWLDYRGANHGTKM